ncbi:hypothetical protein [Spiroplasma poulsonii]|uniref:DUF3887 domain-containing protein n=1 Tax=Spiroplasma poulsonii TaxID=2138 RepID=A0A2P6F978_9MOLU|nr:hypothetical protein [Spiroplasma poulsonii]PQM30012.1 hypothetical protein SMSRO_SF026690 [Spiroplasma poulsonii]
MKKLLSLLSVLTISGTAVPTTIAASPYQKEEKLNNDINYSQTNNLENLSRNKRENNNITPDVKVSYEINDYFSDLCNAINFLQNNDNIRLINPETIGTTERYYETYFINSNNNDNKYFVMPINIENDRRISLIFRSSDFYLQGFIVIQHLIIKL